MEGQPSIEELLNIIELQRKALEFYAEGRNYKFNQREINSSSTVYKDMGHQARFALEQSDVTKDFHTKMIENLDELIKQYEATDTEGKTQEELFGSMLEKIKELKKIKINV